MNLIESTIGEIVPQDSSIRAKAKARLDQLTMPHWALGRLMDLALDLAGMTRSLRPEVKRRAIVTMAADHGVAAEGVSHALAGVAGARVVVVDMGVAADLGDMARQGKIISKRIAAGTKNMTAGPAMSREEAIRCVEAGIEVAKELGPSTDLFGAGDMGIGNTTPASAVVAAVTGNPVAEVTGKGTGIGDEQLRYKIQTIEKALTVNKPDPENALDMLAKVGGFEIGGIAGLVLGAAAMQKPILLDGFPGTAGALIAHRLAPESVEYMIASHRSVERGHKAMHDHLDKVPLLDLDLRLGEGTGAALAMGLVDAAVSILTEIATFEEAGVSEAGK